MGVDFPIETLNPFAPDAFGVHTYGNLAWATMYDIDPDTWDRMPEVVEAVSSKSDGITVNDDGTMTVTYKLIDEARWSEGKPITGFTLAFTTANDATARFSEIVDAARTAVDPVEFLDLVREAESILAAELPVIPLFSRGTGLAIWPDAVTGVISNGSRSDFTWNIELWQSPGQ